MQKSLVRPRVPVAGRASTGPSCLLDSLLLGDAQGPNMCRSRAIAFPMPAPGGGVEVQEGIVPGECPASCAWLKAWPGGAVPAHAGLCSVVQLEASPQAS